MEPPTTKETGGHSERFQRKSSERPVQSEADDHGCREDKRCSTFAGSNAGGWQSSGGVCCTQSFSGDESH